MKTAVKPQTKAAPVKTAAANPDAPPRRRTGVTPLTPMRVQAAKSMSRLADNVRGSHPDLPAAQHLMDAARTLRQGNEEASQRHLRAAMFSLTPQSLMRNGQHTDDLHIGARSVMHDVHRHLLLVKDITDVAAKNQQAIRRDSYDDDSGPMPQPPAHSTDPNAGYGPGALAQKPTPRQPGGDRALNAPNRSSSGGSDPNVADPVGPQPRGSKQFSYSWDDLGAVIDMASRPWLPAKEYWAGVDAGTAPKAKFAKTSSADLVTHADGTVTSKKTKAVIGRGLVHADGKWVATHADGTVSKHGTKQGALAVIAARHNKAGASTAAEVTPKAPAAKAVAPLVAVKPPSAVKAPTAAKATASTAPAPAAAKVPLLLAANMSVRKDGSVIDKKSGAKVGEVRKNGLGNYEATHADGAVTKHGTKTDALKAIATRHNKAAKSAAAGNASALQPKPSAPAASAKAAAAQPPQPKLSQEEKAKLVNIWSHSYRYSNESLGTGKEGRDFTDELHRLLSTNTPPSICGPGCQSAHKFLGMVDQDATVQHKELQRGIKLSAADAERMFQPGKTADIPAVSWTTKPSISADFAKSDAEPGQVKVVLHTAPPAKGLNIASMSAFPEEAEVVTGGRYSVNSVQTKGGVMHVYVTQKGFSAN